MLLRVKPLAVCLQTDKVCVLSIAFEHLCSQVSAAVYKNHSTNPAICGLVLRRVIFGVVHHSRRPKLRGYCQHVHLHGSENIRSANRYLAPPSSTTIGCCGNSSLTPVAAYLSPQPLIFFPQAFRQGLRRLPSVKFPAEPLLLLVARVSAPTQAKS